MGKRGNENAQQSKEDYEAFENAGSSSEGVPQGFARASEEELSKRRIVRPARKSVAPSSGTFSFGGASTIPPAEPGSFGGLFANVNLTASSAGGLPSKPNFAMPSAHTSATKNPFGGISLTSASKEAPAVASVDGNQSQIEKLVEEFKKHIAAVPVREDPLLAVQRFMTMYFALKNKDEESKENVLATTTPAKVDSGSSTSTANISSPSLSLFSLAPAPVAFSFGRGTTTATQPQTSSNKKPVGFHFGTSSSASPGAEFSQAAPPQGGTSKAAFSFGTNIGANSSDGSSPAPASGFNFSSGLMQSALVPGTNVKIALTPVPGPSDDGNGDGEDAEFPKEKTELPLASADTEWNDLRVVPVKVYNFRNEGKPKQFAGGALKVQQHKNDATIRRMVMRDPAGKVLVNIGIFKGMKFLKMQPGKKTALGGIVFLGSMDETRGPEKFQMRSSREDIQELHTHLEELSA